MQLPIPDITPPTDISPGGLINWLLGAMCAIIVFLWKLNEGKNAKAIENLDARLVASDAKHLECENDRNKQAQELAVMTERLNQLEKQFVHGAG